MLMLSIYNPLPNPLLALNFILLVPAGKVYFFVLHCEDNDGVNSEPVEATVLKEFPTPIVSVFLPRNFTSTVYASSLVDVQPEENQRQNCERSV